MDIIIALIILLGWGFHLIYILLYQRVDLLDAWF